MAANVEKEEEAEERMCCVNTIRDKETGKAEHPYPLY